ncbi:amidase [Paenisporosarcina sp. TG20]|uniref:amidase n=1 Tax=Paenisporosarcina sp. TG20 TaxID=1211706 RepID=UPI0002F44128|nr:amidase family protein [Paenisporosarcina sp. TG20]
MSKFEYGSYDAMGLAELVTTKEITATEILEAAISKTEELNPKLNAVIHKMYDQAREHLNLNPSGAFAGVPMFLKNITQEIKNEPITSGSKAFLNYTAKEDSEFVKRIRTTGAVFLGQTNVPELALMGITEPKQYGASRNPWNIDYTPGGSSGGSAAAVASGMVPIAGANDGGGSIRIPAAYCGLFGLKPTRGRAPVGRQLGRQWQGASADHVLTKSVRDSAMMLDLTKGYEPGAAFHAPPFECNYLDCVTNPLEKRRRIAYSLKSPIGTEVDSECKEAVLKTVALLESMGHLVEEKDAPVDGLKIANSYMTMYFGEVAASLASAENLLGRKIKYGDVEPTTWLLGLLGKATNAEEWVLGLREWDVAAYSMEDFHTTYDFYVTPTTAYPPAKIGELDSKLTEKVLLNVIGKLKLGTLVKKTGLIDEIIKNSLKRTPFTQLANLTGQPAMSVPMYKTKLGLPLGVQFIAAKGREDLLYRMAGELEQTDNWLHI